MHDQQNIKTLNNVQSNTYIHSPQHPIIEHVYSALYRQRE